MKTIRWDPNTSEVTNFDKLLSLLDDGESTLRKIAYYIRCSDDYQVVVDYYRQKIVDHNGCVGAMVAFDNLQHLPALMTGYKERFILSTF